MQLGPQIKGLRFQGFFVYNYTLLQTSYTHTFPLLFLFF